MPTARTDCMCLRHPPLGARVCSQQTVYIFAGSFGFNIQGVGQALPAHLLHPLAGAVSPSLTATLRHGDEVHCRATDHSNCLRITANMTSCGERSSLCPNSFTKRSVAVVRCRARAVDCAARSHAAKSLPPQQQIAVQFCGEQRQVAFSPRVMMRTFTVVNATEEVPRYSGLSYRLGDGRDRSTYRTMRRGAAASIAFVRAADAPPVAASVIPRLCRARQTFDRMVL